MEMSLQKKSQQGKNLYMIHDLKESIIINCIMQA